MIKLPCPTIYCDGEVEYVEQHDSQGVDGWAMSFTYWEMENTTCDHEYNIEQGELLDKLLDERLKDYVPDYSWGEP